MNVQKWLTEEEWMIFERFNSPHWRKEVITALEACREIIKENQYQLSGPGPHFWLRCIGCKTLAGDPCKPDCAIATALQGVGGDK